MGKIYAGEALLLFLVAVFGVRAAKADPSVTHCNSLQSLTLANARIVSAEWQPAEALSFPAIGRDRASSETVPAFCRVRGVVTPTSSSHIVFEVWLPQALSWNGKLEGIGNHAFLGAISYDGMAQGLRLGYATAATDTGHVGDDLTFGSGKNQTRINWAYLSVHLTTQIAKLVVRDYFGRLPAHSYFQGCDSGGQEGLSEATRYPTDYDGIVAGNPAADRLHEVIGYLGVWEAVHDADGKSLLPPAALRLLTKSVVAACDANDGVKDGVIEDPQTCHFDVASLACKDAPTDSCLTPAQIKAVHNVYTGVSNPRTGSLIFPGWAFGSEAYSDLPGAGWSSMVNGRKPRRVELLQDFVFDNPAWDWHTFDFDKDVAFADRQVGYIAATSNDLKAFSASGGKLLMYMGWSDPILPAADVIDSFDGKVKAAGGPHRAAAFMRLYMVPGMGHCKGGPGTTTFDMLAPLQEWVEKGIPPTRIVASRPLPGGGCRTRPLCPWPEIAHWNGSGSTNDAVSFTCAVPSAKLKHLTLSTSKGSAR